MWNWAGTIPITPKSLSQPTSIDDVRQLVAKRAAGDVFRPLGQIYSFSGCIDASGLIAVDPSRLQKQALFSQGDAGLPGAWSGATAAVAWVEAGVRIHDLCVTAAKSGANRLCPFTLGGSSGQTLVGAAATSTHGADFNCYPLTQYVLALHAITERGDVWVERPGLGTTDAVIKELTLWDRTADRSFSGPDDLDAMLSALGTAGVITGALVALRPDDLMNERTYPTLPWSDVRAGLVDGSAFRGAPGDTAADPVGGTYRYLETIVNPYDTPATCIVVARNEMPADGTPRAAVVRGQPNVAAFALAYLGPNPNYAEAFESLVLPTRLSGVQSHDAAGWVFHDMSSVLDVGIPNPQRVYSYELVWPVTAMTNGTPSYLAFLDRVIGEVQSCLAPPQRPYAGTITLRFSKASTALLSMQHSKNPADTFAHVELSCLQNVVGNTNDLLRQNRTFLNLVFSDPSLSTARPHWGQGEFGGLVMNARTHPTYTQWLTAINNVRGGSGNSFQSVWTKRIGLAG